MLAPGVEADLPQIQLSSGPGIMAIRSAVLRKASAEAYVGEA
jgi:hypothetical protein